MKKLHQLIDIISEDKEQAKKEMLEAACITDIRAVLEKAGEQAAYDKCILKIKSLFERELIKTNKQVLESAVQECDNKK